MKKINSYQWLSECGKFGVQKIAVNPNATKFDYNVCRVFKCEYTGALEFYAYDTCELLRDAKAVVSGWLK